MCGCGSLLRSFNPAIGSRPAAPTRSPSAQTTPAKTLPTPMQLRICASVASSCWPKTCSGLFFCGLMAMSAAAASASTVGFPAIGTVISSALFGALAAAKVFPFPRDAFEAGVRAGRPSSRTRAGLRSAAHCRRHWEALERRPRLYRTLDRLDNPISGAAHDEFARSVKEVSGTQFLPHFALKLLPMGSLLMDCFVQTQYLSDFSAISMVACQMGAPLRGEGWGEGQTPTRCLVPLTPTPEGV